MYFLTLSSGFTAVFLSFQILVGRTVAMIAVTVSLVWLARQRAVHKRLMYALISATAVLCQLVACHDVGVIRGKRVRAQLEAVMAAKATTPASIGHRLGS